MANRIHVTLVDDLDGSEAKETIAFALDGKSYEIDLNERNAAALRAALEPFITVARSTRARARARGEAGRERDAKAIRLWAQAQGLTIAARGRIPSEVIEKYRASA